MDGEPVEVIDSETELIELVNTKEEVKPIDPVLEEMELLMDSDAEPIEVNPLES